MDFRRPAICDRDVLRLEATSLLTPFHQESYGTAMALLQAGVDIAVIALWLGHESIDHQRAREPRQCSGPY